MGQNRKNGKGNTRRMTEFEKEIYEDSKIEKVIGYRQILVTSFIVILVVLRETYYPSHLYITDLFKTLIATAN